MKFPFLVHEFLEHNAGCLPDKEALIYKDKRYNYSQLDHYSDLLGLSLIELDVKRQDRVLIYLDNCPEIVISIYGILKAGGVFVILNSAIKYQKLSYIIEDSGANILITSASKYEEVFKAIDKSRGNLKIIWIDEIPAVEKFSFIASFEWKAFFNNNSLHHLIKEKLNQHAPVKIDKDIAALIYTSGSTGDPKGVISSHFNMISAAKSIVSYLDNKPDEIILNALPLSFDYGLYQVIMAFIFGGTIVLEDNFIFLDDMLNKIAKEKVTGFPIVPMMLTMLLNNIDITRYDLSSLRYMTNTGAALPVEHIRKLRKLLPHVKIFSMFGLTECKRVSYLPPDEIDRKPSSVGKAMPNCEVFIADENGKPVKKGEPGELVIRGSNVMQGYWNAPELTAKVYREGVGLNEKLLFSGDYFKMDDEGFLYFLGRRDDMIKSRGERISAREIENIIHQIDGVNECAVIGIPDEILGQSIKVFIIKNKESQLSAEKVRNYCLENLEPWAVPGQIEFC